MMRVFVAIEISNNEIVKSIEKFQTNFNIDAKPINSKNLHFTLQFLGEISEEILQEIIQALKIIKFTSFNVNLKGIGVFPKPKYPKVVWIGTDKDGGNMLIKLAKKIESTLKPIGLSSDKSFKPHITIFRIKKDVGDITKEMNEQKTIEFGLQKVTSIKLKKSQLTSNGPIYSNLMEINAIK